MGATLGRALLLPALWLVAACAAGSGQPAASQPAAAAPPAPAPPAAAPAVSPTAVALGRVSAAHSIVSTGITPLWLAEEQGLWQQHGLEVELTLISGGPPSAAALIAGEVRFIHIADETALTIQAREPDMVGVANYSAKQSQRLIVQPDVQRAEDLRGKRVGVFTIGDGVQAQWSKVLQRAGLSPERDVTWIAVGGGNQSGFVAALAAGAIDAALLLPPNDLPALKNGARVLGELADFNLPHPGLPTYVMRRTLESQRPTVEAYLKGMIDGVRLFYSDPQLAKEALSRRTGISDPDAIEAAYRAYSNGTFTDRPYVLLDNMRAAIDDVAPENPDVLQVQLDRAYDNSVLQDIERQGYFARR